MAAQRRESDPCRGGKWKPPTRLSPMRLSEWSDCETVLAIVEQETKHDDLSIAQGPLGG